VRCDGARVELVVRDEGPGIAPDVLATLFDRHRRGESSRVLRPDGSGLGLSIVDAIVRAHGGHVHVESAPGLGSTFTVTVPLFVEPEEER
jgi:two-component system OmpR family sensor kinase